MALRDLLADGQSHPGALVLALSVEALEDLPVLLEQVASGAITPEEGKKLIALISMGMEPVEIQELAKAVEELSNR